MVNEASVSYSYIIFAVISCLCCLAQTYVYRSDKKLRVFPNNLVFWRTCCDFVVGICNIIVNVDDNCNREIAFLTQTSLIGSFCWYFCLTFTLHNSVANPFFPTASMTRSFHICSWAFIFITGFIVIEPYFETEPVLREDLRMCWTIEFQSSVNPYNWGCLYFPVLICCFYSIWVLMFVKKRLSTGSMAATLATRERQLHTTKVFTLFCLLHCLCLASLYFWVIVSPPKPKQGGDGEDFRYILFACVYGVTGCMDACLWFYTNNLFCFKKFKQNLRVISGSLKRTGHGSMQIAETLTNFNDDEVMPDISEALRAEFILSVGEGIRKSLQPPFACAVDIELTEERLKNDSKDTSFLTIANPSQQGVGEYKFMAHAPQVFSSLRKKYGISDQHFLEELMPGEEGIHSLKANFSEGKSGSFFYFSQSRHFLVKTLEISEHKFLPGMLANHYKYMIRAPNTTICRFLGWYSIELYGNAQHLIVLENVLLSDPRAPLTYRYDLKGSVYGRHVGLLGAQARKAVLKDQDCLVQLRLGKIDSRDLFLQIARDAQFLYKQGIMDYSLLLGVHYCTERREAQHCSFLDTLCEETAKEIGLQRQCLLRKKTISSISSPMRDATPSVSKPPTSQTEIDKASTAAFSRSNPSRRSPLTVTTSNHIKKSLLVDMEMKEFETDSSFRTEDLMLENSFLDQECTKTEEQCVQLQLPKWRTTTAKFVEGPGIYYLGIIDTLEHWRLIKKAEHWSKRIFKCYNKNMMSAVPPKEYCKRFILMVAHRLMIEDCFRLNLDSDEVVYFEAM